MPPVDPPGQEGAGAPRPPGPEKDRRPVPSLVGRKAEVQALQEAFRTALKGRGSIILIEGEIGIGKTRLLNEAEDLANSIGVRSLSASCLGGGTPLMSFLNALENARREAPDISVDATIEEIFYIHSDSRLILHDTQRRRPDLGDSELRALLEEIKKTRRAGLRGLFLGDRRIIIEAGAITVLAAVIRGDETPKMRQQMKYLLATIEDKYGETLMNWKGYQADLRGLRESLRALLLGDYGRPEALRLDFEVTSPTVFDDIARFVVASSSQLPQALLFDDIHWMDPVSLHMVAFLAERIEQSRVVLVGTYRPEELTKEPPAEAVQPGAKPTVKTLSELLVALKDLKGFSHIRLGHLTRDELVEMISSMYPEGGLGPDLFDFLFRHGEGNPFYTEEILRSLESSGKLKLTPAGWRAQGLSEMDVPVTIREAVLVRMAGLDKREREVLQHAAVIGREWEIAVLESIMKAPTDVKDVLKSLEAYNLVASCGEGHYRFEHDVVREAAYEGMSEALRKLYHKKVGEAFEAVASIPPDGKVGPGGIPDDILFKLAYHFSKSKDKERALKYNLMAGDVSKKAHDNRRARTFLTTALDSARGLKGRDDVKRALFDLARIQEMEGDWDQAQKDYEELLGLLVSGEEATRGRILVKMARLHEWRAEWDKAMTVLEKAQAELQGTDDKVGKAMAMVEHARVLRRLGNYDRALAKAEEALATLGTAPPAEKEAVDVWLEATKERGGVLNWQGRHDEVIKILLEAEKVSRDVGNDNMTASILQNLGLAYHTMGEIKKALEAYEKALEIARNVGNTRTMAYAYANLAEILIKEKRFDEATSSIRKSLEIFYKSQDRLSIAHNHMIFGALLTEKGDMEEAIVHFNMALELALDIKETTILAQIYHHYGRFYAKKGDTAMAKKLFKKSIALHTEVGRMALINEVKADLEKLEKGRRSTLGRVTIGRKTEIIKLLQAFKEADQGHGRVVVVEGGSGTGKSKIIEQFLGITKPQKCLVLMARCTPREKMVPYSPFIEALEAAFSKELPTGSLESIKDVVKDNPREMLKLFPMLATLPGVAKMAEGASDARSALSSIQREQDRLFENITKIILSLAKGGIVLLVLEDFHWADVSSIGLLHYLARGSTASRLLAIVAYSPDVLQVDGKTAPLTDTLRLMNRERLTTSIVLGNLSEKETAEMVYLLLDGAILPPEVHKRIFRETEGNPFFIEEVVLNLVEQGILDPDNKEKVVKKDLSEIQLPRTMSQIVERKLQALSEIERRVLMLAGIIGYKFDYETLRGMAQMPEDKLVGTLDDLVEKGLLIEDEGASEEAFRFPFEHFRRVAIEGLLPSERIKIHDKIARLLEKRERPEELAFDLAIHHREAGNLLDAARWSLVAGERARRLAAPELAEQQVKNALSFLEQLPPSREVLMLRARAHDNYADICTKTGRYDEANGHVDALMAIASSVADERLQAMAWMAEGRVRSGRAMFAEAKESFMKALGAFEKLGDLSNIIQSRRSLSTVQWRDGLFDDAIANLQGCMVAARKLGDEAVIGAIESALGNVYRDKGDYDQSIEHFLNGIKILEKGLDQYELATAYNNIGATYRYLEKWDLALEYFEKCIALCRKINFPSILGYGLKNKGEVLGKMGRPEMLDEADKACDEAMDLFKRLSHTPGIANVHMNKGIIRRARKDWVGSKAEFEKAVKSGLETKVPDLLGDIYHEYAIMLKASGDTRAAREQLTKALEIFDRVKATSRMERAKALLAEMGGDGR